MRTIRKWTSGAAIVAAAVLMIAGCGSEVTSAGAGIAGGFAASNTLKGMQMDLERREASLIAHYNELAEAGAKAETLEQIKEQIATNQVLQQGTQAAGQIAETDWGDPAAAGGAIGTVAALAYALLNKRKLGAAGDAIRTIRAGSDETMKHTIDKIILEKKAAV